MPCDMLVLTVDIWETLPEFANVAQMYENFKAAILILYPAADDQYRYLLDNMDLLIGTRQRLGIQLLADLAQYHSQFIMITTFLKAKGLLSDLEQNGRTFILHGTHTTLVNAVNPSPPPVVAKASIKTEQLSDILNKFKKSIVDALAASATCPRYGASSDARPCDLKCNFCGKDHFICNCKLVNDYKPAGKVKRNADNKVILPSRAFVPSSIPGNLLKDSMDKWHRRNPGQLGVATLSNTMLDTTPALRNTIQQFTLSDRIALVEAELFALRAR
ncbi:hypothetical protein JR316_0011481 [Psilocybe cubensis]|uniref:Uncharacterized protein n=1 Tax=Psilocybe cubensis TaxID=181762 RepID=A0ACB8GKE1_PSICU|nr:hypothetical protein JR316_0011481 [Psilocybe cubensis]KAH9475920.1 hypothetical protein JR316_0011481 [Psilocybe cubensis]